WLPPQYPISAIYEDTWREPQGPWAVPGHYTVRLTAAGKTLTQPLELGMDPRIQMSVKDLASQFDISMQCYGTLRRVHGAETEVENVKWQLDKLVAQKPAAALGDSVAAFAKRVAAIGEEPEGAPGSLTRVVETPALGRVRGELLSLMDVVESVDAAPTPQAVAAAEALGERSARSIARWETFTEHDLEWVDGSLAPASLPVIAWHAAPPAPPTPAPGSASTPAAPAPAPIPDTDIFVANLDLAASKATAPRNITNRAGYDNQPAFLRDGSAVLYVARDDSG